MKSRRVLAIVSFVALCLIGGAMAIPNATFATTESADPQTQSKQARFAVDGMTCASCSVTVKAAAEKVEGVSKAGASSKKGTAWAIYNPAKTNPKAIAAAITKAGYRAIPSEQ